MSRAISPLYSLCITANDGTFSATVNVTVSVISPVSDDFFSLQFALPVYTFDVPEQAIATPSSGGVRVGLLSVVPVYKDGLDVVSLSTTYRTVSNYGSSKFAVDQLYRSSEVSTMKRLANHGFSVVLMNVDSEFAVPEFM